MGFVTKSLMPASMHSARTSGVAIDLELTVIVTGAAVMGSIAGASLSKHVPAPLLRRVFAGFVLLMAGYVIGREAGPMAALGVLTVASALLAGLVTLGKQEPPHDPDETELADALLGRGAMRAGS